MKKIALALFLSGIVSTSYTCDICGCTPGTYDPFLFPHLSRHFIGFSYQHRLYKSRSETGESRQSYNAFLLSGQFSISKKFQVVAMLPYQANQLVTEKGSRNLNGMGDVSVLINYKALDKVAPNSRHTLMFGAGAKLPTGEYSPDKTGMLEDQNFQLGTGSVDYLINGSYHFSHKRLMLNLGSTYKYNTQNKDHYRYGDVLTARTTASYRLESKPFTINPYLQLINEIQMKDADDHKLQSHSGGNMLYAGGGVDVTRSKIAFGVNYLTVASQHLAGGEINVKPRLSAHISFIF